LQKGDCQPLFLKWYDNFHFLIKEGAALQLKACAAGI
jgi:hypothetical protein